MARLIGTLGSSPGAGTPGTPTSVTASAGNAQATVSWTNPNYTGKGGTVTYRVISSPGNIQATTTSNSVVVTGLSNGTAYTFTVRAETSYGINGSYSSASSAVTPVNPTPTVNGGTLTSDATYYYRTFNSSGTLSVSTATLTADVMVVGAGGGGAGGDYVPFNTSECPQTIHQYLFGGGGGGGGVSYSGGRSLTVGNYSVSIGGGGAGAPTHQNYGTAGGASSLTGTSANGGNGGYYSGGGNSGNGYSTSGAGVVYSGSMTCTIDGETVPGVTTNRYWWGGGGGGSGGNAPYNENGNANGGAGVSYFGTTYGAGGPGGNDTSGANGQGIGGAGGNGYADSTGASGGSGRVVVRYTRSQVGG